jgi:hypothetical protein
MADKYKSVDQQVRIKLTTDFLGEDRHEFVQKLAYKLWEDRGRPFGSPEVDWCAAERATYAALVAAGLIAQCEIGPGEVLPQDMAQKIYG